MQGAVRFLPASEVHFGHIIRSCSSMSVLYCKHDLFSNLHVLYSSHAYVQLCGVFLFPTELVKYLLVLCNWVRGYRVDRGKHRKCSWIPLTFLRFLFRCGLAAIKYNWYGFLRHKLRLHPLQPRDLKDEDHLYVFAVIPPSAGKTHLIVECSRA